MEYSQEELTKLLSNRESGRKGVWNTDRIAELMTANIGVFDAVGNVPAETVITAFEVVEEDGETSHEETGKVKMSEVYKGDSYKREDYKTDNARIQCILKSIGASLERKFKKAGFNSAHRLIDGQLCVIKNLN